MNTSKRKTVARVSKTLLDMAKKGMFDKELAEEIIEQCGEDMTGRYLVVLQTDYQGQEDELSWKLHDTLKQAKDDVEEYLFKGDMSEDWGLHATVYDVYVGKTLDFDVVQEIRWKEGTNAQTDPDGPRENGPGH